MKNGYDQFFKQAQKAATQSHGEGPQFQMNKRKIASGAQLKMNISDEDVEARLRAKLNVSKKAKPKRKSMPWGLVLFSLVGALLTFWGFNNYEAVEKFVKNVEVEFLGTAVAQTPSPAQTPAPAAVSPPSTAATEGQRQPSTAPAEIEHLTKIHEKTKELAAKEEELQRVEQELALQKVEIEKRMKELEEMRAKISSILEERVKVDSEKVDTLVQMYTNMKPVQAAKVIETIDEDLAIEILGRMKKKNAADIMNMIKPEKAQSFTEKLAGFKR